jgi:diguanylate cyclase (GGDEF)-like protein
VPGFLRRIVEELRGIRDWRRSTKVMIGLLIVALSAIYVLSQQQAASTTALITKQQSQFLATVASTTALQVQNRVLQYGVEARQVASDTEVVSFMQSSPDQRAQSGGALLLRLKPVVTTDPDYRLMMLLNQSGVAVISSEPGIQGQDFSDRDFYLQGKAVPSADPYISDITLAEDRRSQIMYVADPIRDARGILVGVAVLRISPEQVSAPLQSKDLISQHRDGILVNRLGLILANSHDPSLDYRTLGGVDATQAATIKQQYLVDKVQSLGLDNLANSVAGATSPGFTTAALFSSGETDVIGWAPVPGQRWTVLVAENQNIFTADVQNLSRSQFLNWLILALIIAGLVLFAGRMFESTARESLSDPLTGLANRRFFQEILLRELRRAQRSNQAITLVIADIDHFKGINDTYGHNVGDEVLEQVAGIMLASVRATDFVIRYGGEEFILLLPETRIPDATAVADKLRRTIGDTILESTSRPGITLKVTISAGIAGFPADGQTGEQIILKADKALYFAKQNGRNKVCTVQDMEGGTSIQPIASARR